MSQGSHYPIYILSNALISKKLVANSLLKTLHWGVGYTVVEVRERFWIPKLRQLTKRVIHKCYGCKRFPAVACTAPAVGNLPLDHTSSSRQFHMIGINFAGPLIYIKKWKQEEKVYLLVYSCSLTRAVYMDLMRSQSLEELLTSLQRFITCRGRPEKVYSDNFSTFAAASKWLKVILKEEKVHEFLAKHHIKWQLNFSRAPWRGGQFERIIGLTKQTLLKAIGKVKLTWKELESVLLDTEITLNNQQLGYIEDDIHTPILTPNFMILAQLMFGLEGDIDNIKDCDPKNRT